MSQPQLLAYRGLIWNFAQRDLKARFKGTAVGWVWSLILPIASLLTYTLVARYVFRGGAPAFGNGHAKSFAVWLFAGLTAWGLFTNSINTAIGALLGAGPLLKKIFFPAYAPVLGAVVAVAIQSLIEIGLVVIAVLLVGGGNIGWSWVVLPLWALIFGAFVASLSLVLAIANIFFRDLAHIVSVFLQLLFYATPILYQASQFGTGKAHAILRSNPVGQFVDLFRDNVYGLKAGAMGSWLYVLAWTAASCLLAVWAFSKFGMDLSEEL